MIHWVNRRTLALILTAALVGCGGSSDAPTLPPLFVLGGTVQSGGTHGVEPLEDVRVTLLEATSGDPRIVGRATTDAAGGFAIRASRQASDRVFYARAELGDGVVLVALLGDALSRRVTINELTTIAAAYTAAQFFEDGVLRGDALGLRIAAGMSDNIVDTATGESSAVLLTSPNANETNALRLSRSVGNLLSSCVQLPAIGCEALFELTTPPGGERPTDTWQALVNMVLEPANNVSALYAQSQTIELFLPPLEDQPDAWTLAIKFNDSGDDNYLFGGPGGVAFDSRGYAYITNNVIQGSTPSTPSGIVLQPNGKPADGRDGTPTSPLLTGGVLGGGLGLDVDAHDHAWLGNFGWGGVNPEPSGSVSQFRPDGSAVSGPFGHQGGTYKVQGVIAAEDGNVWLASFGNNRVVVYPGGDPTNSAWYQEPPGFLSFGVAVGSDGVAWVTNTDPVASSVGRFEYVDGAVSRLSHQLIGKAMKGIVLDSLGNAWAASGGTDLVYQFDPQGTLQEQFNGGGINGPWGITVDGDDNVWVGNFGPLDPTNIFSGRLSKLAGANPASRPAGTTKGEPLTPPTGYTLPTAGSPVLLHNGVPLYGPGSDPDYIPMMRTTGVQVDRAGNVWCCNNWKPKFDVDITTNPGGDGMVVFLGIATPPRD